MCVKSVTMCVSQHVFPLIHLILHLTWSLAVRSDCNLQGQRLSRAQAAGQRQHRAQRPLASVLRALVKPPVHRFLCAPGDAALPHSFKAHRLRREGKGHRDRGLETIRGRGLRGVAE